MFSTPTQKPCATLIYDGNAKAAKRPRVGPDLDAEALTTAFAPAASITQRPEALEPAVASDSCKKAEIALSW